MRATGAGCRSSSSGCSAAAPRSTPCSRRASPAASARLDADVVDLLRLGADQLLHMNSVPAYAAIAQTVELVKQRHGLGASRLANAVLRRIDRERDALGVEQPTDPVEALALEHSHPRWLVARWVGRWGADATARLLAANNAEPPTLLRAVRRRARGSSRRSSTPPAWSTRECALVPGSLEIVSGPPLTTLAPYREGAVLRAGPGRDARHRVREPSRRERASPTSARRRAGSRSSCRARAAVVIAADRSVLRAPRLAENITRVHAANVFPMVADARHPAVREVDAVLLDAPCSGTGTFRRHPDARWRLKPSDVAVMTALQRALIRAAAAIVRPGGLLVYSTCSIEPEENDAQVESFLADGGGAWTLEPPPAGAVPAAVLDAGRLRVLPQSHGVDGAFAARLRRAPS